MTNTELLITFHCILFLALGEKLKISVQKASATPPSTGRRGGAGTPPTTAARRGTSRGRTPQPSTRSTLSPGKLRAKSNRQGPCLTRDNNCCNRHRSCNSSGSSSSSHTSRSHSNSLGVSSHSHSSSNIYCHGGCSSSDSPVRPPRQSEGPS